MAMLPFHYSILLWSVRTGTLMNNAYRVKQVCLIKEEIDEEENHITDSRSVPCSKKRKVEENLASKQA